MSDIRPHICSKCGAEFSAMSDAAEKRCPKCGNDERELERAAMEKRAAELNTKSQA